MNIEAITTIPTPETNTSKGINYSNIAQTSLLEALISVIQSYLATVQANYEKMTAQDRENQKRVMEEKSAQKGYSQAVMEDNRASAPGIVQGASFASKGTASSSSPEGSNPNGASVGIAPSFA